MALGQGTVCTPKDPGAPPANYQIDALSLQSPVVQSMIKETGAVSYTLPSFWGFVFLMFNMYCGYVSF